MSSRKTHYNFMNGVEINKESKVQVFVKQNLRLIKIL